MASIEPFYRASSTTGKTWQISSGKSPGRPARVYATEGVADGTFFTTEIHLGKPDTRPTEVRITGPATARKLEAALTQLLRQMEEANLFAPQTEPVQ